jgi:hypothetical protein
MARDEENAKRLRREWYLRNRELTLARSKKWAEENPEKRSEILSKNRAKNKDSRNEYNRNWFADNPDKRASYEAKRRSVILQRIPKWVDDDEMWVIGEAYDLAQKRTQMTGKDWHVDHIVPLQGKNVSGLHVSSNIQVILGVENCRKHARFLI